MSKLSPEVIFEELFVDLHLSGIWEDGKLITDAIPKFDADHILQKYRDHRRKADFDLKIFFEDNFETINPEDSGFIADTSRSVTEHIELLWDFLLRKSFEPVKGSSSLPLPFPYIVPGGRFNEIYYWDSYFTMLGLKVSNRVGVIENMLDNFAHMIDNIGFIPNGSRSYFLSRSQPPFFAMMVELLASIKGEEVFLKYHNQLLKEYSFWMTTDESLVEDYQSNLRVVNVKGGILNRYFDALDTPRAEMYGADVELSHTAERDAKSLYKDLRSACESGWDFSSRWLNEDYKLESIQCSKILPIDLNCLLYQLERLLEKSFTLQGNELEGLAFGHKASERKQLINRKFWDSELGFYMDYNFEKRELCSVKSLAAVYPLYFNIASQEQATSVANVLEEEFLKSGGLISTTIESGQQWDSPNGWAPLQWMAITALRNYGFMDLAEEIKQRWVKLNIKVYKNTGKLLEKYNVVDMDLLSGGGEYPVQDGFGWTNGVLLRLINE